MATSSRALPEQTRPYQGYPFVNPVVIDVPTLDATTAAKWANLPRRPIGSPVKRGPNNPSDNNPSIYIDLPNEAGDSGQNQPGVSRIHETAEKEDIPVVYIELPDDGEYNGEGIPTVQDDRGMENPAYVQETIFFDPFENRQIDVNKSRDTSGTSPTVGVSNGHVRPGPTTAFTPLPTTPELNSSTRPARPLPPIKLNSPSSQGGSNNPGIPGFMNKESQHYGGSSSTEDGFTLTPLPVNDYPDPPPAYSEVAETADDRQSNQIPPRTVVVVPNSPTVGLPSSNRKLVQCQNCRLRVHTVVVKENGPFTHFVALITVILCLLPITVIIYCTDFFKYRVHFCPNCNQRIGYEIPILCQDMVYNRQ